MFAIRLVPLECPFDGEVTLRNSIDGWDVDVQGIDQGDWWLFALDETRYRSGVEFKFVLGGCEWMSGYNLYLVPQADGDYRFHEGKVRFARTAAVEAALTPRDVRSDGEAASAGAAVCTFSGTIRSPNHPGGVGGLRVTVVDRNVGGDLQLAEAVTDERGQYTVSCGAPTLRGGKQRPDLQARVYSGERELGRSEVRYDADVEESLDILLPADTVGLLSEYETLVGALATHYGGVLGELRETEHSPDITYLANKAGFDPGAVALAAVADLFGRADANGGEPVIPPALYYALFRAGLPADSSALSRARPQWVKGVWECAFEQGIIPVEPDDRLERYIEEFIRLGARRVKDARAFPGASTVEELARGALGEDQQRHEDFADLLVRHRGDPDAMWNEARHSLGAAAASRLELDGKLAYLTSDNAPLMERLHDAEDGLAAVEELAQRGYYRPERWADLIGHNVPEAIPGDTPEQQRAHYAEMLAEQVRLSFPTAVVAMMLGGDELPLKVPDDVKRNAQAFLVANQGTFDIGTQPLDRYIIQNELVGELDEPAREEIKRIQRVYQITPTDDAMAALLGEDLDSAYRVVQHTEDQFLQMFGDGLGERAARLTYAKAQQVHNAVLNVACTYLNGRRAPAIGSDRAAPIVGIADDAAVKTAQASASTLAYPTLEDLFGSMDYCECEHCRSILSPAAYLVDLLLFLDHPVNGMSPQSLLFKRRPDLQNLPLTCENTNTVLPYIDVVNETLEHYVANDLSLGGYAGHDTGDVATPEELLASPQFVEEAAYTALQAAIFPPPLPFHKALETVRRHVQRLGVPLPEAMEKLRLNDAVERPDGGDYGWHDILLERLTMCRQERAVLVGPLSLQQLYGFEPATTTEAVLTELRSVRTFTRRTGLTVAELTAILRTGFVNPNSALLPRLERLHVSFGDMKALHDGTLTDAAFRALLPAGLDQAEYGGDIIGWVKDNNRYQLIMGLITIAAPSPGGDPCSLKQLELRLSNPDPATNSLDGIAYTRLLQFIRLWKRLGWTVEQTDMAIEALLPDGIDDAGLSRLGTAAEVMARLGLPPSRDLARLLACWAPITTKGASSLYGQMFLRPTTSPPDAAFADNGYGDFLTDPAEKLLHHADTLRAAFHLTGEELADIVAALSYNAETPLTLDTISQVHRRGWLARVLHLSVRELLQLSRWTGLNPFTPPDPPDRPIVQLLDLLDALRAASLTPVQALYLIWNQDLTGRFDPGDTDLTELVRALRADAATIDNDFEIKDDPGGEIARTQMALVYGTEATDFFFGLLDDTHPPVSASYTHPQGTLEPEIPAVAPGRIAYDHSRKQLSYIGILSRATSDALKAVANVPPEFTNAVDRLYTDSQKQINPFFTRYKELRPLFDAYAASDKLPQERRRALLDSFLPQLKDRRTAQQAVALTAATTGTSGPLAQTLLTDAAVLHADADAARPALQDLIATETPGLSAQFFWAGDPGPNAVPDATKDTEALNYSSSGPQKLPTNPTAGAPISGIWSGRLETPEAGSYSFAIETDPGASVTFTLDGNTVGPQEVEPDGRWTSPSPINLTAGSLHPVKLRVGKITATMKVRWETTGQGWQPIPTRLLYSEALLRRALNTYVRFIKAASLAGALRLSPAELSHFASSPDYYIGGQGWLNALQAFGSPDPEPAQKLGNVLAGLLAFVRVRGASAPGTDELVSLLRDPTAILPTGEPALPARLGWEPGSLDALLTRFGKTRRDLGHMDTFQRVHDAYALVKTSGIPATELIAAVTNDPGPGTVRGLEAAMRARYDRAALLDVLKHVNDELRTLRRDALVTHILHGLASDPDLEHIDTPDKLFELFLMDIQMEPCQQTTRIRHALSSVQLFAERCLMGLEVGEEFPRLYRLWNGKDHSYTIRTDQRDKDIKEGYQLEGVEGYAFTSPQEGTVPLFRLVHSTVKEHFYTIDAAERDAAVAQSGYLPEGIECYVFPPGPREGTTPLFQLWKPDPSDHFYTTSVAQKDKAITQFGYVFQREVCHVRVSGQTLVSPGSIDSARWEWMKRYRVWEANRRVFLWPENWLEPELRNDQSPFFTEVMSELLQGDITEDRAATAMIDYLSRLEEVAQLEPCGMHYVENNPGTSDDVLHVVARTPGSRRAYFYRRREGVTWTPWEPIKLDIEDNPVLPVVWNGRLFLFWLRIIQRTPVDPAGFPTTSTPDTAGGLATVPIAALKKDAQTSALNAPITVQAVLCWSEYYNAQWQSPKTSDSSRPALLGEFEVSGTFDRSQLTIQSWREGKGIRISFGGTASALRRSASFLFYNSYSAPVNGEGKLPPQGTEDLISDTTRSLLSRDQYRLHATYYYGKNINKGIPWWFDWAILEDTIPFSVVQQQTFSIHDGSNWPFFFADSRRAYFVTSKQAAVTVQNFTGFGIVLSPATSQINAQPTIFGSHRLVNGSLQNGDTRRRDGSGLLSPASTRSDWGLHASFQALLSPEAQVPSDGQEIGQGPLPAHDDPGQT